jgi:hypothetical protein
MFADSLPAVPLGPILTAIHRLGIHAQPTRVVLTFSEPLDPGTARRPASFGLVASGPDGRFGTKDDRRIRIRSADYDAATNTVTLSPARRLSVRQRYRIVVDGTSSTGLTDTSGNLLDGDFDGTPGGDYVAVFRGRKPKIIRPFRSRSLALVVGDRNGDGRVNLKDLRLYRRHQRQAADTHQAPRSSQLS